MKNPADGIYNRFLLLWADHSSILNHGHLLFTTRVMYTPEYFYTSEEMLRLFGKSVDVQKIVESPSIYIFGNCSDSLAEKLSYTDTRLDDVDKLKIPLEIEGKTVHDTLRLFIGRPLYMFFLDKCVVS